MHTQPKTLMGPVRATTTPVDSPEYKGLHTILFSAPELRDSEIAVTDARWLTRGGFEVIIYQGFVWVFRLSSVVMMWYADGLFYRNKQDWEDHRKPLMGRGITHVKPIPAPSAPIEGE